MDEKEIKDWIHKYRGRGTTGWNVSEIVIDAIAHFEPIIQEKERERLAALARSNPLTIRIRKYISRIHSHLDADQILKGEL